MRPKFLLYVSLLVLCSISIPQINQFYVSTWLASSCENGLRFNLQRYRVMQYWSEKFHISVFPMYYSLYNWASSVEHEISKLKKKIFAIGDIQKKGHKLQTQKDMRWDGMTQNGLFDIFSDAHA